MSWFVASAFINISVFALALRAICWMFLPFEKSEELGPSQPRTDDEVDKGPPSHDCPTDEYDHVTSNIGTTEKSSTTYRLQGIPAEIGGRDIPDLLREAWMLPEATEVTVHSLATNPYRPEHKVATVSFSKILDFLQPGQDEWLCKVNDRLQLVLETHFRGFTPLHSDPDSDCSLDCIAVASPGGHAFGSFNNKNSSFMWLRDGLPQDLPQSRILTYGYDAELFDRMSFETITDLGMQLQQSINEIRPSKKGALKPLILIGHSLGGLIVKQAVNNMHQSETEDDQMNFQSLRATLFFAVPSLGMNIGSLIPRVQGKPDEDLVRSLKGTSETLRQQKHYFDIASHQFSRYWYYELRAEKADSKWRTSGSAELLVDPNSATNGRPSSSELDCHFVRPIFRAHSEIVKFSHLQDLYYFSVSEDLNSIKRGIPKMDGVTIGSQLDQGRKRLIYIRDMGLSSSQSEYEILSH